NSKICHPEALVWPNGSPAMWMTELLCPGFLARNSRRKAATARRHLRRSREIHSAKRGPHDDGNERGGSFTTRSPFSVNTPVPEKLKNWGHPISPEPS